ncbi:MAG TPA: ATP-binding protein [Planctomycetota bacterium]|nr:ATP-binding protein [Planctomycetota bacterium]
MKSIGVRLTLRFVLVAGLLLAAFSSSLYLWVRDGLRRDLEAELSLGARLLEERLAEELDELGRGVHADLGEVLDPFLQAAGGWAEIRDGSGNVVYRSEGPAENLRERSFEATDPRGGPPWRVRFALPMDPYERPLAQLRLFYLVFFPATLAVAGLAGFFFVKRALAPVETLRRCAERISRANLSERVPEPETEGELRDLARTLNEMLERLERAMEDLRSFAADAAHELRTPLANLRAELETALQDRRPPDEYERILGSVSEEVARMNRIVGDLLALARMDLRRHALPKERVPLLQLLEETRETWAPAAEARGIRIHLEGPPAEVAGDPVALRRVFMNLVENAVKYNREGGRVDLRLDRADGWVRVAVRDTGLGIPPEHLPHLFRRFYRVDRARSRETGGAGLGLALCKSFVEAHEGRIRVESVPGRGSCFTVELPALDGPPAAPGLVNEN